MTYVCQSCDCEVTVTITTPISGDELPPNFCPNCGDCESLKYVMPQEAVPAIDTCV